MEIEIERFNFNFDDSKTKFLEDLESVISHEYHHYAWFDFLFIFMKFE